MSLNTGKRGSARGAGTRFRLGGLRTSSHAGGERLPAPPGTRISERPSPPGQGQPAPGALHPDPDPDRSSGAPAGLRAGARASQQRDAV